MGILVLQNRRIQKHITKQQQWLQQWCQSYDYDYDDDDDDDNKDWTYKYKYKH